MTYLFFILSIVITLLLAKIFKDERIITLGIFLTLVTTVVSVLDTESTKIGILIPLLLVPVFLTQTNKKLVSKRRKTIIRLICLPFYILMIIVGLIKSGESLTLASGTKTNENILDSSDIKYFLICSLLLLVTIVIKNEFKLKEGN